jgi:aspartate/methionine/tyrosine aminotransferase
MWFERMVLEVWFDDHQYQIDYDIGESAVKYKGVKELGLDLDPVGLRYGYHYGRPDLREIIAADHPGLGPDDVIVTSGASEAIFCIASALLSPGGHCIIEHPNYPSLYTIPRGLGADVSLFDLRYDHGFKPDLERLEAMIRPNTKLIAFTHPNNPTGSMISQADLERLATISRKHDIHLLFDETYREMDRDNCLAHAAGMAPKAISISTMSKSYGLPGIRIGWAVCQDRELLEKMLVVREHTTITNNALGEEIALKVLERKERILPGHRAAIQANKQIAAAWVRDHAWVEWVPPEVGVVALPRLKSGSRFDPERLYQLLAGKYRTFCVPGRCFEIDNRYFRLGFGALPQELQKGLANFDAALAELI